MIRLEQVLGVSAIVTVICVQVLFLMMLRTHRSLTLGGLAKPATAERPMCYKRSILICFAAASMWPSIPGRAWISTPGVATLTVALPSQDSRQPLRQLSSEDLANSRCYVIRTRTETGEETTILSFYVNRHEIERHIKLELATDERVLRFEDYEFIAIRIGDQSFESWTTVVVDWSSGQPQVSYQNSEDILFGRLKSSVFDAMVARDAAAVAATVVAACHDELAPPDPTPIRARILALVLLLLFPVLRWLQRLRTVRHYLLELEGSRWQPRELQRLSYLAFAAASTILLIIAVFHQQVETLFPDLGVPVLWMGAGVLALLSLRAREEALAKAPSFDDFRRGPRPILYIRSFGTAPQPIRPRPGRVRAVLGLFGWRDKETLEEIIIRLLRNVGPVVTLQSPKDTPFHKGASREDVADHSWRSHVDEYLKSSQCILFATDYVQQWGPGLRWEFERISEMHVVSKLLILLPVTPYYSESTFAYVRRSWCKVLEMLDGTNISVPADFSVEESWCLFWTPDGQPVTLEKAKEDRQRINETGNRFVGKLDLDAYTAAVSQAVGYLTLKPHDPKRAEVEAKLVLNPAIDVRNARSHMVGQLQNDVVTGKVGDRETPEYALQAAERSWRKMVSADPSSAETPSIDDFRVHEEALRPASDGQGSEHGWVPRPSLRSVSTEHWGTVERPCPTCGASYRLSDYRRNVATIYCSDCKHELPYPCTLAEEMSILRTLLGSLETKGKASSGLDPSVVEAKLDAASAALADGNNQAASKILQALELSSDEFRDSLNGRAQALILAVKAAIVHFDKPHLW